MNRRQFVTAVGVGGATALSGCLGYEVTSSDDIESQEDEIAALEADVADLEDELEDRDGEIEALEKDIEEYEAEIEALEDEIEQRNDDVEALEAELEDRRTELSELVESQLTSLYEAGHALYELAQGEFERAFEVSEQEEYGSAIGNLGAAFGHYDGAIGFTYRVVTLAENRDEDAYAEAIALATDANIYGQHMKSASDSYSLAFQHHLRGDSSAAEDAYVEAEAAFSDAQEYSFASVEEFVDAL